MKYVVTLNGMDYEVEVNELSEAMVTSVVPTAAPVAAVAPAPVAAPVAVEAAPAPVAAPVAVGDGTKVIAPMPGTILSVNVTEGAKVKMGDVLMILEAMKMENEIMCPQDGTVTSVNVTKGATVESGSLLCAIQ